MRLEGGGKEEEVRWILIVYISKELWTTMGAYPTEARCYQALAMWEAQGGRGACLMGEIERKK